MNKTGKRIPSLVALTLAVVVIAQAQTPAKSVMSENLSVSGKVVSSSNDELVIQTGPDQRMTFIVTPTSDLSKPLRPGTSVKVEYWSLPDGTLHVVRASVNGAAGEKPKPGA